MDTWIWLTIAVVAAVGLAALAWWEAGRPKRLEHLADRPADRSLSDWPAEQTPTIVGADVTRVLFPQRTGGRHQRPAH